MKSVRISVPRRLSRRTFLKGAGVCMALPFLESMTPAFAKSGSEKNPSRFVAIGNSFGMYQPSFFPNATGAQFDLPELLQPLKELQPHFSVLSGLDHGLTGGHFGVHSFLSGVLSVDAKSMPDGNITLDQRIAESLGSVTRFPTLTVGSNSGLHEGCQMSWSRSGVRVPPITHPRELFQKLFVNDSEEGRRYASQRSALKKSILDSVQEDAATLSRRASKRDQEKLDEYFTAIRDAEQSVMQNRHWINVPKPQAPIDEPINKGIVADLPVLYDLILLALQTDATRIATLEISSEGFDTSQLGISGGYHSISHHGQQPDKIRSLVAIERYQTEQFARFLGKLRAAREAESGASIFDDTIVLFGSGMGNANSHTNTNLPIILSGGGFKHGQHIAYSDEKGNHPPLSNLYLSIMNRMGIEASYFAKSDGTLRGLTLA